MRPLGAVKHRRRFQFRAGAEDTDPATAAQTSAAGDEAIRANNQRALERGALFDDDSFMHDNLTANCIAIAQRQ
ncbi:MULTISPECIES: hypothetical protein [unclassified Pseudomonas]|uniref:hypothetical protein n=1 Tax=unclassified Pseudomonas TaxID=196821 RepID=UPI0025DA3CD7|nr:MULTISPECIES: hypothetical protein [unclassified Pseudomonas]